MIIIRGKLYIINAANQVTLISLDNNYYYLITLLLHYSGTVSIYLLDMMMLLYGTGSGVRIQHCGLAIASTFYIS